MNLVQSQYINGMMGINISIITDDKYAIVMITDDKLLLYKFDILSFISWNTCEYIVLDNVTDINYVFTLGDNISVNALYNGDEESSMEHSIDLAQCLKPYNNSIINLVHGMAPIYEDLRKIIIAYIIG